MQSIDQAQARVRAARDRLLDLEQQTEQARADYRAAILNLTEAERAERAKRRQPDPRHHRTQGGTRA